MPEEIKYRSRAGLIEQTTLPEAGFPDINHRRIIGQKCTRCGEQSRWPGFVYSHFHKRLIWVCPKCGQEEDISHGIVGDPIYEEGYEVVPEKDGDWRDYYVD